MAYFQAFCLEQYRHRHGLTGSQVAASFARYGVMDYLADNYEVLHTQGHRWLVAEIDKYMAAQKKKTAI